MVPRKTDSTSDGMPTDGSEGNAAAMPRVTLGDDGIIWLDYSPCIGISLEVVQYSNARHRELCPGIKSPLLLTAGKIGNVDYRAQRLAASAAVSDITSAMAVVTQSFLEHHLARMFIMYHRPPYPIKVFRNVSEARSWLNGFLPRST